MKNTMIQTILQLCQVLASHRGLCITTVALIHSHHAENLQIGNKYITGI